MFLSEKFSFRLKRVYIGIAVGVAVWLLYTSCLVLSNAVSTNTSLGGVELVLTLINSTQK